MAATRMNSAGNLLSPRVPGIPNSLSGGKQAESLTRTDSFEGQGKDESGLMKGKVGWRLVISLASEVSNSHLSRSANATKRQS
jgi:hypothetical protein